MVAKLIWLALAGAAGTLARYGLAGLVQRWAPASFPWGTLAVNVLGCFLFGLVWSLGTERMAVSAEVRTVILIGFMGAFTTFSSFAGETSRLMAEGQWLYAAGNILLQNVAGIAAMFLGYAAGRAV
ncbi:MAG: fluoride efflux transporter CrcB [Planctomycetaceae bacterium]|nr:fluoride efflux transporter CrcB [Planctomycetaceae bacterium]